MNLGFPPLMTSFRLFAFEYGCPYIRKSISLCPLLCNDDTSILCTLVHQTMRQDGCVMKIEKGVPLHPRLSKRVEVGPLPLANMKVGDSIRVDAKNVHELERKYNACRIRYQRFTRKNPHIIFRICKDSDSKGPYLRIWRVSRAS